MNPVFAFVFGLLVAWLFDWLIDYVYWRRRYTEKEEPYARQTTAALASESDGESRPTVQTGHDDLKIIKGIGTVIERKLNDAGIFTFEQLGNLTPADLRRILGDAIESLADEESLLQQARDFARQK
ncbi:MAG TPA: hypothetical protein VK897_03520 [Anaerolineales bacterium]|nr:hypothetical protein [Anaerolineales bacterium]